ncbi:MAG: hypothetical protein AAGJ93_15165 [Bacteroidota bacterium]
MAKKKAKVNRGPYIKNANLIGKGGGQIKPVEGSYVKGARKARPKVPPANPNIRRHIKTEPAKKNPVSTPSRHRTLSAPKQPKTPTKKTPVIAKAKPKTVTSKKAPSKAAIAKVQTKARQQSAPKKATPQKKIVKKAPAKGR